MRASDHHPAPAFWRLTESLHRYCREPVPKGRFVSWMSLGLLVAMTAGGALFSVYVKPGSPSNGGSGTGSFVHSPAGFAGYNYVGVITDVSVNFIVPSITSIPAHASYGAGSTWIGAQNPNGSFVQVGITEYEAHPQFTDELGRPYYSAFWSDTAKSFHPLEFATVQPGDVISVSMRLEQKGWLLSFKDDSSSLKRSIESGYGQGQDYNFAEWIQEDPVSAKNPLDNLPYTSTTPVDFSRVEVDGKSPQLGSEDRQAMDPKGGPFLEPTRFVGDRFSVIPVVGSARQYLSDVSAYDYALTVYSAAVAEQRGKAGETLVVSEANALMKATENLERELTSQTWPSGVHHAIEGLASSDEQLGQDVGLVESQRGSVQSELQVYRDEGVGQQYSDVIRALLDLPPPN